MSEIAASMHGPYRSQAQPAGPSAAAIGSLVLAAVSFATCGPFFSFPAALMAKSELARIARGEAPPSGKVIATIGFYFAVANVAFFELLMLLYAVMIAFAGLSIALTEGQRTAHHQDLSAIETHLVAGQDYAQGPDAERIAHAVRAAVQPSDAIAVQVMGGAPRRILVLVRPADSQEAIEPDDIVASIDAAYDASADELGVGLLDQGEYRATVVRTSYRTERRARGEGQASLARLLEPGMVNARRN